LRENAQSDDEAFRHRRLPERVISNVCDGHPDHMLVTHLLGTQVPRSGS